MTINEKLSMTQPAAYKQKISLLGKYNSCDVAYFMTQLPSLGANRHPFSMTLVSHYKLQNNYILKIPPLWTLTPEEFVANIFVPLENCSGIPVCNVRNIRFIKITPASGTILSGSLPSQTMSRDKKSSWWDFYWLLYMVAIARNYCLVQRIDINHQQLL